MHDRARGDMRVIDDRERALALATGGGHFAAMSSEGPQFGTAAGAGSWTSDNLYPRELADVTGDGLADIVGFGISGTYVAPWHEL